MTGPSRGWPGRQWRAARFALGGRGAATTALAGFMVRGGIVPLVLPIVVLPSVIDLAGAVGVDAFSIAGQPTTLLVGLIITVVVAATCWLIGASLFGSLTDFWLVQMALSEAKDRAVMDVSAADAGGIRSEGPARDHPDAGDGPDDPPRPGGPRRPDSSGVLELAAIRIVCIVPLALVIAWTTTQIFTAAYTQLITPSDISTPLPIRVILAATSAAAILLTVWLLTEALAAVAVRRHILTGSDFVDSIGGALRQILRRPIQTLATEVVPFAVSAATMGLAFLACSVAFDWCRIVVRTQVTIDPLGATVDIRPILFAGTALVLSLSWIAAIVVAAIASAWRSAAFTFEVQAALDAEGRR